MPNVEVAATAVFKALDTNYDGTIDMVEFLAFAEKLFDDDDSKESILKSSQDIIALADKDGDERLNLQEWLQLMEMWDYKKKYTFLQDCRVAALEKNAASDSPNEELLAFERKAITREVFDTLDVDGTGTVDFDELSILVDMLHLKDVNVMMRQLDLDRDGHVSAHEWEQVMLNHDHIKHPAFFDQMREYKRKIRAVQLDFLKQKAADIKAVDATLDAKSQVEAFLHNNQCELSFVVKMVNQGVGIATFSEMDDKSPVPSVGVHVAGSLLMCRRHHNYFCGTGVTQGSV